MNKTNILIILCFLIYALAGFDSVVAQTQLQAGVEQNIQLPAPQQLYPAQFMQPPLQYQQPCQPYQQQYQQPAPSNQPYSVLQQGPSVIVPWYFRAQQNAQNKKIRKYQAQITYYQQTHGGMLPGILPEDAPTGPPIINGSASGGQDSRILSWDEWYRRISAVDEPLVEQALASHGNPTGNAHLWVTVTPSHHLSAELQDSTNSVFGQSALEGVRALDGNPALEYPTGSKRETFSFQWTSNHQGTPGRAPDVVNQTTIVGDREKQLRQW